MWHVLEIKVFLQCGAGVTRKAILTVTLSMRYRYTVCNIVSPEQLVVILVLFLRTSLCTILHETAHNGA
jgi:hypothetical protein